MKKLLIYLIIILGITLVSVYIYKINNEKINSLKFSNTQQWGEAYSKILSQPVFLVPDALDIIQIKEPPLNTSKQTKQEIIFLHNLVAERSDEKIHEIEMEIELDTVVFNGVTFEEIIKDRPNTNKLLNSSLAEIGTIMMYFKNQFDRVRPSVLDTSLTTSIPVPEHPAYPSGHATQSFLIALILSDIEPQNREIYIQDAHRIAHNREIAGVHYPSDSEVGREIASQYFKLLNKTNWYQAYLVLARSEWVE